MRMHGTSLAVLSAGLRCETGFVQYDACMKKLGNMAAVLTGGMLGRNSACKDSILSSSHFTEKSWLTLQEEVRAAGLPLGVNKGQRLRHLHITQLPNWRRRTDSSNLPHRWPASDTCEMESRQARADDLNQRQFGMSKKMIPFAGL